MAEWISRDPDRAHRKAINGMEKSRKNRPTKQLLRAIKSRSKLYGWEFSLTEADIVAPEKCPVFGIELKWGVGGGKGLKNRDRTPSVDRIDNTKGYTRDNIVVVSYRANRLKSDGTLAELRRLVEFYENLESARGGASGKSGLPTEQFSRDEKVHVPRMQSSEKEKKRPLPFRNGKLGRV